MFGATRVAMCRSTALCMPNEVDITKPSPNSAYAHLMQASADTSAGTIVWFTCVRFSAGPIAGDDGDGVRRLPDDGAARHAYNSVVSSASSASSRRRFFFAASRCVTRTIATPVVIPTSSVATVRADIALRTARRARPETTLAPPSALPSN
mmetsp:Transcript_1523/g.4608  ORF Transcript_1523/g.4608 Transcript_1523/m.4608 type:complete len:151 (-) Transcript_1523:52-504(-)